MVFAPIADFAMIKSEVTPFAFEILQPVFEEHQYLFLPTEFQFRKTESAYWQNVILGFSPYQDLTIVECTFGVRIHRIEKAIAPFLNGFSAYQNGANTAICNLSKYSSQKAYRYKIKDEADIYRMAADLKRFFETEGFAFLDSLVEAETLNKLLNGNVNKPSLLAFNEALRAFRGLAVASELGEEIKALSEFYQTRLTRYAYPIHVRQQLSDFSKHLTMAALK